MLVTGGAGYIGRRLSSALAERVAVTIIDRSPVDALPGVESITADVRDEEEIDDIAASVDCIFHHAAEVDISKTMDDPRTSASTNVLGTLTILEAARRYDIPVLLASSAAVYGDPLDVPVSESAPKDPTSPYGLEKLVGDRYAALYRDLYDLDVLSLRYFNVYGPGSRSSPGVIRRFISQSRTGGPITIHGDGSQTRDFVYIDDVIRVNLLAASSPMDGSAINVGTGTAISIRTLAEMIRDHIDPTVRITSVTRPDGDIQHSCADMSRAAESLGFTPSVSIDDGIERLVSDAL